VALLISACSGGDDDGGDPLSCSLNTSFAGRTQQSGAVILQMVSNPCRELNLDVVFTGVSSIFTVGFDITYPASIFTFDGFTEGPLLKQGSPAMPPIFSVTESPPGRTAVFATRLSPDRDVSVVGSSVLLTLRFKAASIGEGAIVFDPASSPVEEQVRDDQGALVLNATGFLNGSNLARVF
jgi:hypothetical protein